MQDKVIKDQIKLENVFPLGLVTELLVNHMATEDVITNVNLAMTCKFFYYNKALNRKIEAYCPPPQLLAQGAYQLIIAKNRVFFNGYIRAIMSSLNFIELNTET